MAGKVYVGCSGWAYPSWRPAFYPDKTPVKKLLASYAARLNAVEVNYTFRSVPSPSVVANWLEQTPKHFRFAPKAPQRLTHILRLRSAETAAQAFAASVAPLTEVGRLGPVLFQLPPGFRVDAPLLADFLSTIAPLGLASTWEFRDSSWFVDRVYDTLAMHGAALCAAESDTLRSPDLALNPGLRVFRLRRSHYTADEIQALSEHFRALAAEGAAVYAFWKHEEQPDGALRALDLLSRIPAEWQG